jgi:glucosamine--fructose-6-phosphate aminotransferase (isomerizing)
MFTEIEEIPAALERLFTNSMDVIKETAEEMKRINPALITTVARGSSDHAAAYLTYAIELVANVPVASLGPSVATLYGRTLKLENTVSLSISQSGQSPDIVQMARSTVRGGALAVAITNDGSSPLAAACHKTVTIEAGVEKSVAATKTFVISIVAGLLLLARWQDDTALMEALMRLPGQARAAISCDWLALAERLEREASLLILGRGPSMAIANEAALKFKETCRIHAEAYSSAEVMHGPVSIVRTHYPLLALAARDASEASICTTAVELIGQEADVFITSDMARSANRLPFVATGHPLTDPLMLIISFYGFIEKLARQRGLDPDMPVHLKKVTETL